MIKENEKRPNELPFVEPYQFLDYPSDNLLNTREDYIIAEGNCQGFTEKKEIEAKFVPKRKQSELLSASFSRLDMDSRSRRVSECGTFLEFAHQIDLNGNVSDCGKLHNANFCRDRLCPMCSWRRSYKVFAQVSQIMSLIKNDYAFLFLTLTIPNVTSSELNNALKELQQGWYRLRRSKKFKNAVQGYFKALEITYNQSRDDYHPHFHIVLAVAPSYFTSRDYIKQSDWLQMWREAMRDETITQVDVRRAKSKYSAAEVEASDSLASAIAEIAKYAVK